MTYPMPQESIPGQPLAPSEFSFTDVNTLNGFVELVSGPTADGDNDLD